MEQVYNKNTGKDRSLKRFLKLLSIPVLISTLLLGCDFLDYDEQDQYSKEYIYSYIAQTKAVLSNIYSYLPTDYSSVDNAMRASASDDAEHAWELSDIQKFNDGGWNPNVLVDNQWGPMYSGIRAANQFIKESDGLTFDEIKYNEDYDELMIQFAYYPYEARFLRAFFYFELAKRYGDVPLITDVLTTEQANKVEKSSFEDIVDFIVSECDILADNLPVTYSGVPNSETGRATKGAAMALKARTLLYAASSLHNATQEKWIAAAIAAKELIDQLGSTYTPLPAYGDVFNKLTSKELILERRQSSARTFEERNTAIGFTGGNAGTCPTQNLVDAYEMKATGLGKDESGSGYDPANPYATSGAAQRDPRLAMTILFNGAKWKNITTETWNGGLNAPPKPNATKTGYYIKKHMIESISLNPSNPGSSIHYWVIFRYAEVLLNYAEAMNEAYGPEVTGPGILDMTARAAVNIVRARTGIVMPAFPVGMTPDAFREKLRNERRVELAFEDHRFWDIRRWKIGNETTEIRGMDIVKDPDTGVLTFTEKVVENRVWNDKMYLYPIPQKEIFLNTMLTQNPGW